MISRPLREGVVVAAIAPPGCYKRLQQVVVAFEEIARPVGSVHHSIGFRFESIALDLVPFCRWQHQKYVRLTARSCFTFNAHTPLPDTLARFNENSTSHAFTTPHLW